LQKIEKSIAETREKSYNKDNLLFRVKASITQKPGDGRRASVTLDQEG